MDNHTTKTSRKQGGAEKQMDEIRRLRARLTLYRKSTYRDTVQIATVVDSLLPRTRRYIRDMVFRVAAVARGSGRSTTQSLKAIRG